MKKLNLKRKILIHFLEALTKLLRLEHPNKLKCMLFERINFRFRLTTSYGDIFYNCPNETIYWRMTTFDEKEPDTIEWIKEMNSNEIFCDIGANIGLYSLLAAKKGMRTYSFEPEALNYAELCKNISVNQFQNISSFNIAIADSLGFLNFKIYGPKAGAANHLVEKIPPQTESTNSGQNSYCNSIDNLISTGLINCPNHIKIDVDGYEFEVVKGMTKTLKDSALKSLLVEIDETRLESPELIVFLKKFDFEIFHQTNYEFKINNYIFKRKDSSI